MRKEALEKSRDIRKSPQIGKGAVRFTLANSRFKLAGTRGRKVRRRRVTSHNEEAEIGEIDLTDPGECQEGSQGVSVCIFFKGGGELEDGWVIKLIAPIKHTLIR